MGIIERDVFLWLKRPTIANIRAVLQWAQKRALKSDIRCRNLGEIGECPPEMDFENILRDIDRKAKLFFRIVVRKGMNDMLHLDSKKRRDLLGLCISVWAGKKEYDVVFYLGVGSLGSLKRKFSMSEEIVH